MTISKRRDGTDGIFVNQLYDASGAQSTAVGVANDGATKPSERKGSDNDEGTIGENLYNPRTIYGAV